MKSLLLVLLLLTAPARAGANAGLALANWQQVLESFVDEAGRTDFRRLASERRALDAFVAWLANNGPATAPGDFPTRQSVIAYHINAYNALAMHGIIERGIPRDFSSFFKRARFFRFHKIAVDGNATNLYDYENEVIRPLGDARVHFALNCMVRSCPRLPRAAFAAASLDAVLDALTREFFADEKHLVVNANKRNVAVSAILDFYTKDFVASGKHQDLTTYISRYRDVPVSSDYHITFLDYDWTVNQSP